MHARADVEKSADAMLATGMESKNQNQMALALQVKIFVNAMRSSALNHVLLTPPKLNFFCQITFFSRLNPSPSKCQDFI